MEFKPDAESFRGPVTNLEEGWDGIVYLRKITLALMWRMYERRQDWAR